MTTEMITFSEYRKNLSSLWKRGHEKKIKYLVLVHWKPAFEMRPIYCETIQEYLQEDKEINETNIFNPKKWH